MASQKQIQANRANAQKSTGPRSAEGKRRVSLNSFKHGFYTGSVLLLGENVEAYQELLDAVLEEYRPEGVIELELASRIVFNMWQLRRLVSIEAQVIRFGCRDTRGHIAQWDKAMTDLDPDGVRGYWFGRDVERDHPKWESLQRHRMRFERSYYKALHELERLQRERAPAPSPTKQAASPQIGFVPSKSYKNPAAPRKTPASRAATKRRASVARPSPRGDNRGGGPR